MNGVRDALWELTLQIFRHHNLMTSLQVKMFDIKLKHIDLYPADKVHLFQL